MREYKKALWVRGLDADIVNISLDTFNEISYSSILKAVACPPKKLISTELPYGLKVYHDKDGGRREHAYLTKVSFHALGKEFLFGGNLIVIGEVETKRAGLSDYQIESIRNKNIITIGCAGKIE